MIVKSFSLGEVCEFVRGVTFPSGEGKLAPQTNAIACLTTSGVQKEVAWQTRRFIPIVRVKNDGQILRSGDILISTANSKELVGKSCIVHRPPFPCTFGAFVTVARPQEAVYPPYLAYWMRTPGFLAWCFKSSSNTTNISNLRVSELKELQFFLPELSEQKRIAGLLAQADRLRRTRRYALELSDTLLSAAFLKFFGDLRQNDHHWPFVPLESHAEIASGVAKGQKYGDRETIDVPYLRVANVQDGYLDLSEIKVIRALPTDVESLRLKAGDIVMTEGGDFDKLGRGAIWPGGIVNCIHQNHIFRVRLDTAKLLPIFFAEYLRSAVAKNYFLRCSKQTTNLASINMTQLRATPVPLPPLEIQVHFSALVERHKRLYARHREALRQADHLFQSLLNQVFASHAGPAAAPQRIVKQH